MADTQYIESSALLAILTGNDDRAHELVKDLLTGERLHLMKAAERLAFIANPANTCPVCGELVVRDAYRATSDKDPRVPLLRWHWTCWLTRQENRS